MIKRILAGFLFIIFGLLVAIGPRTVFSVCGAMDGKFMKCHWTAQAELGIGLGITIMGILLILFQSKQIRIGISIAILLNAILVILLPRNLIGVCGSVHMTCHSLTLPALTLLGVLILLISAATILYLWKENRKEGSL